MTTNSFDIEFPLQIEEILDYPPNITWRGEGEEKNKKIKLNTLDDISNDSQPDKKWSIEVSENSEIIFKAEIKCSNKSENSIWTVTNVEKNEPKLDISDPSGVALYLNEETYLKKGTFNNVIKTTKKNKI